MGNSDKKPGWFSRRCCRRENRYTGKWLGIGIAIGTGIGVALDNIAVGVGIGIILGAAMSAKQRISKPQDDEPD